MWTYIHSYTGIRTALAPRAEETVKKFSSLKPSKLHKNVYRYLTESKTLRDSASRIIRLPTKFLSNAQPWRAVLLKGTAAAVAHNPKHNSQNSFYSPEIALIRNINAERRFSPEYSSKNDHKTAKSSVIYGIKGTKSARIFSENSFNHHKIQSPAMMAKYHGLKH